MSASQRPWRNRGERTRTRPGEPRFPLADEAVRVGLGDANAPALDILFVNPPAPDRGIWIDLAVDVLDAIPFRMGWDEFEAILRERRPRYYVTQVAAPTLQNDMYGAFVAKSLGATTIAFGTHVTPLPKTTMEAYPALDFVLRGEPELTLYELIRTLQGRDGQSPQDSREQLWPDLPVDLATRLAKLFHEADPDWSPVWQADASHLERLARIKGLVWRNAGEITMNAPRPLIRDLDDLPLPRHELLPLARYRAPLFKGPFAFVVTSRGCPGGCRFCIKHVSYGDSVRFRSPGHVVDEIEHLVGLGVSNIHMYADLFTVNREHVMGICEQILSRGLPIHWTCNSRVDFVDREMLQTMARSGCWMISWGIESGDNDMLRRMHKGTDTGMVSQALAWSKEAGIRNWGYFIIGLPGETEETIRKTIAFSKRLPLDLVLFHIAAPHPGTPFFFEVVEHGWFRPGTRWEQVDMDRSTVLDYPNLSAEALEGWARRALRAWLLRPRPFVTFAKMVLGNPSLWRAALDIGIESLGWAQGGEWGPRVQAREVHLVGK
jgi:anaerobic magnesium-protoporphyrin IX monomethyl ester cyclase